jgi:hypothetical protein
LQRRNTREGWWEPLGGEVEKRAPTIDKSTKAKGEKTNTYPTSVNPAVLEMFKRFLRYVSLRNPFVLGTLALVHIIQASWHILRAAATSLKAVSTLPTSCCHGRVVLFGFLS